MFKNIKEHIQHCPYPIELPQKRVIFSGELVSVNVIDVNTDMLRIKVVSKSDSDKHTLLLFDNKQEAQRFGWNV